MERIFVEDHYYYKEYYLLTDTGKKKLHKLPFRYGNMEYCALLEDDHIVIYKVPKAEELTSVAQVIIPSGSISRLEIKEQEAIFDLNSGANIFNLPADVNQVTIGQTPEGLLYAICSTTKGNDLYFLTYNGGTGINEWVKKEENVSKIEMLDSFSYKVTHNDQIIIVDFVTQHISPYATDITASPLHELRADSINTMHNFNYDEIRDWTRIGEELYRYYLIKTGKKISVQEFVRLVYSNSKPYSLRTIFDGSIDEFNYLTNIKREGLLSKIDERVSLGALCGYYKTDLSFAYPIMFLDGSLVRVNNAVNITGGFEIVPALKNLFVLIYPGNKKKAFHFCEYYNKNDGKKIRCYETGKHDEFEIIPNVNYSLLLGVDHNILGENGPEDRYSLYYFDNGYSKALVKDACKMDILGDDWYIFYFRENGKWIIRVFDRQGSMLCVSNPMDNIDDLKKDYKKEFHLLFLQFENSKAIIRPMKGSVIDFDFLNIKDYRIIDIDTSIINAILLEYEVGNSNNIMLYPNTYNHHKKYIWFTPDGKGHPCDFSKYYHVRHIEDCYFEVQSYPNGPINTIKVDIHGHSDAKEIMGRQMIMSSLI